MATLIPRKSKKTGKTLWTVQVTLDKRRRPCVPLGAITKAQAQQAKGYIESLASTRRGNLVVPPTTADWLRGLDVTFYDKLVEAGLVDPRQSSEQEPQCERPTLGSFLDSYVNKRSDVKSSTTTVYRHTCRCLIEFFNAAKPLADITPAEAKDFRRWLTRSKEQGGQDLAENTARRRCGIAKQFFTDALERELIHRNPFAKMKGMTVGANRARHYFITREQATAILDACPNNDWRLIFALARYGGLRCPSEYLELRWEDVDWERQRIRVRSPKTEHHEGHEERLTPLFPELRPYLEVAWDEASEGAEHVVTRIRDTSANLRTHMRRIIRRAGLVPWPKLFVNLRATRATELADEFPSHVCAAWLGHSTTIADRHYRQVTEDHFARAIQFRAANAQQQSAETEKTGGNGQMPEMEKCREVPILRELNTHSMGDAGLEHSIRNSGKYAICA